MLHHQLLWLFSAQRCAALELVDKQAPRISKFHCSGSLKLKLKLLVKDTLDESQTAFDFKALDNVKASLEKGETLVRERLKYILLYYGCTTIEEYKKNATADDSDDD